MQYSDCLRDSHGWKRMITTESYINTIAAMKQCPMC